MQNLRFLLLLIISLFITNISLAQVKEGNDKINVAIYDFSYTKNMVAPDLVPTITQYIVNSFQNNGLFNVVDRSKLNQVKQEKDLQKTREFFNESMVTQGKSLGAEHIVTGNVDEISTSHKISDGKRYYSADISFSIKVLNVATGAVLASKQITTKGGGTLGMLTGKSETAEDAVRAAMKKIDRKVNNFISENFAATSIYIVEITDSDDTKAKKVLISAGKNMKVKKGKKLEVFIEVETTVAGKKMIRQKNIGELKVVRVEDENFSVCQVKKGAKEILSLINDGKKIMAKFKQSKFPVKF